MSFNTLFLNKIKIYKPIIKYLELILRRSTLLTKDPEKIFFNYYYWFIHFILLLQTAIFEFKHFQAISQFSTSILIYKTIQMYTIKYIFCLFDLMVVQTYR